MTTTTVKTIGSIVAVAMLAGCPSSSPKLDGPASQDRASTEVRLVDLPLLDGRPDLFLPDGRRDLPRGDFPRADARGDLPGAPPDAGPCGHLKEPCCSSGAACTAPDTACGSAGLCVTCGNLGEPCCAGSVCKASGVSCRFGVCAVCGGPGEPCCAGSTCAGSGLCSSGICKTCGGPGEPCCVGNGCNAGGCCSQQLCVTQGTPCSNGGVCSSGSCGGCGGLFQACCSGSTCSATGTTCSAGLCTSCGKAGEICCGGGKCTGGLGWVCSAGYCVSCGDPAQPCCTGSICNGPATVCKQSKCYACGQPGQPCCTDGCGSGCCDSGTCVAPGGTCSKGDRCLATTKMCAGCGGPGQPCCAGDVCNSGCCATLGAGKKICVSSMEMCGPDKVCSGGVCSSCGGAGQPCCAVSRCDGGLGCDGSTCKPCGAVGGPCCTGGLMGGRCAGGRCVSGTCKPCGGAGEPCCDYKQCTGAGLTCSYDVCKACGGANQPCCPDAPRCSTASLTCDWDTCHPCGGPGQECCADRTCNSGCCAGEYGQCVAVGSSCFTATGQTCGANGSCQGCGGPGEPCCVEGPPFSHIYCTAAGHGCNLTSKLCVPCGDPGQPCCGGGNRGCTNGCCTGTSCIAVGTTATSTSDPPDKGCFAENRLEACGQAGLPPCPGAGPACAGGGCVDPTWKVCVARGTNGSAAASVCKDGAFVSCGQPGQACCELRGCKGGSCCVNGSCLAFGASCPSPLSGKCSENAFGSCGTCGGAGQPCCTTSTGTKRCLGPGLACSTAYQPTCQPCGLAGIPCCEGKACLGPSCCGDNNLCKAPGTGCHGSWDPCNNDGSCQDTLGACGGMNMKPCTFVGCTAPLTTGAYSYCTTCGGQGQTCCATSYCSAGLGCKNAKCELCGGSGQPCCDGMFCTLGSCGSTGLCP